MLLAKLITAAAMSVAASTATVPIYLELDGVYYSVPAGSTFEYLPGAWVVSETSMTACNRRNNEVQQYSNFALLYGPNLDFVYLNLVSSYSCYGSAVDEACVLTLASMTGDILWRRKDPSLDENDIAPVPGTFSYAYRFSIDGTTATYCDLDGAGSNAGRTFDPTKLGVLIVKSLSSTHRSPS